MRFRLGIDAAQLDGRAVTLTLAEAGRAVTPELACLADENDRDFFGGIPREDRESLRRLLGELARSHHLGASPVD